MRCPPFSGLALTCSTHPGSGRAQRGPQIEGLQWRGARADSSAGVAGARATHLVMKEVVVRLVLLRMHTRRVSDAARRKA